MFHHAGLSNNNLQSLIRSGHILLGGNRQLKTYGTLSCRSGKRIKKQNRVFFSCEREAVEAGYRPCGYCMKAEYKKWKTRDVPQLQPRDRVNQCKLWHIYGNPWHTSHQ